MHFLGIEPVTLVLLANASCMVIHKTHVGLCCCFVFYSCNSVNLLPVIQFQHPAGRFQLNSNSSLWTEKMQSLNSAFCAAWCVASRSVVGIYGNMTSCSSIFIPSSCTACFVRPTFCVIIFCDAQWFSDTVCLWYRHRDARLALVGIWLPDMSDRCVLAFRESPSVFTILTDCVWLFPGHLQTRLVHCGGARWTHQRSAEGKSQSASCSTNTGSVWSYLYAL